VSYSRHDEALVKPLAGLLGVAADDAVFLDVASLKPGDLWEQRIVDAVKEASVFVVCWCCESNRSIFVAKEITIAMAEGKKRLVPVLFCTAPLPPNMANRQWIDLCGKIVHDCSNSHTKKDGEKQSTPPSVELFQATRQSYRSDEQTQQQRPQSQVHDFDRGLPPRPSLPPPPPAEYRQEEKPQRHVKSSSLTLFGRAGLVGCTFAAVWFLYPHMSVTLGLASTYERLIAATVTTALEVFAFRAWPGSILRLGDEGQAEVIAARARIYFEHLGEKQ